VLINLNVFCKNRINLKFNNSEVLLDPEIIKSDVSCIFVSHAHYDHLPIRKKRPESLPPAVCSKATARLFQERIGYQLPQQDDWSNEEYILETMPGGHTFDSIVAIVTNKENGKITIYTGDINLENRGYLEGYKPIKCNTLILEATYGDRNYCFPKFENQIKLAREYISNQLNNGFPIALLGYPLGKAQLLNHCLGDLCENRFSTESIWKMEQIHTELELKLFPTKKLAKNIPNSLLNIEEPWILFHNHTGYNDQILSYLKRKCNLKVVGFSGWARNEEQYKARMGADAAFIISDHADYSSLLKIIKESSPEKIFTVFGQTKELAKELQKDGFNAVPLKQGQATLESFF